MTKKRASGEAGSGAQVLVRLADDLLERLERHRQRMAISSPGVSVNRSDAIRSLLLSGLDSAEAREGLTRTG